MMKLPIVLKSTYNLAILIALFLFSCGGNNQEIPVQNADFCSLIHRDTSTSLSKELAPIQEKMEKRTGVMVLEDGGRAMLTRAWLSEYAEQKIDVQYFIFSTDNVGLIACDYLVRAADRGIPVRILVDDIMVDAGVHEILTMDAHPNIEIKVYNPGTNLGKNILQKVGKLLTHFDAANQRMHNKTFIVDHKICITGGRNIADEYFDYDHEYNFRDRDILLFGKQVKQVENSFETFWNSTLSIPVSELVQAENKITYTPDAYDRLHQYACNPANYWPQVREEVKMLPQLFKELQHSPYLAWTDSVEFVSDPPGKIKEGEIYSKTTKQLMELIMQAKSSIDIQSPYLITTEIGRTLFVNAVKRGVKVRILTNSLSSTDNLEAFSGYQRSRKDLLETGIRIFEFKPNATCRYQKLTGALQKKVNYTPVFGLHAKTLVIDKKIVVIGTFNLDPRSAYRNSECFALVHSTQIAGNVLKEMETEFLPENAWETTLEFNPDSYAGKLKNIKTKSRVIVPKGIL